VCGKQQVSPPFIHGKSRMRKRACTDLCGGRSAMVVPTATVIVTPGFNSEIVSKRGWGHGAACVPNFCLIRGVHPRLSVQLQSNSRGWLHRASPRKRHQMRHLCDLACLLAKQMLSQLSYTPAAVAHCEADSLVGSSRACCIGNLERNEPVRRAPMSRSFLDKLLH